jgi:hypothetical protein
MGASQMLMPRATSRAFARYLRRDCPNSWRDAVLHGRDTSFQGRRGCQKGRFTSSRIGSRAPRLRPCLRLVGPWTSDPLKSYSGRRRAPRQQLLKRVPRKSSLDTELNPPPGVTAKRRFTDKRGASRIQSAYSSGGARALGIFPNPDSNTSPTRDFY